MSIISSSQINKIKLNLAACDGTFFDRINRINKIFFCFYPGYPVKKWKFLYFQVNLDLPGTSSICRFQQEIQKENPISRTGNRVL